MPIFKINRNRAIAYIGLLSIVMFPQSLLPATAPIKIPGITLINVAPETLTKLGIKKTGDSTISFSQRKEKGQVLTTTFHTGNQKMTVDNSKDDSFSAPQFAPLIVTDMKGNKRFVQISLREAKKKMQGIRTEPTPPDWTMDTSLALALIASSLKNQLHQTDEASANHLSADELNRMLQQTNKNAHFDSSHSNRVNNITIASKRRNIIPDSEALNEPMKTVFVKKFSLKDSSSNREGGAVGSVKDNSLPGKEAEIHVMISEDNYEEDDGSDASEAKIAYKKEMDSLSSQWTNLVPLLIRPASTEPVNKNHGETRDDGLIFWYAPEKEFISDVPEVIGKDMPRSAMDQLPKSSISKLSLYPNPAKDHSTVRLTMAEPLELEFSIYDVQGNKMRETGTLNAGTPGSYVQRLDLSQLNAGIYLLVVSDDSGEQCRQRLIIDK